MSLSVENARESTYPKYDSYNPASRGVPKADRISVTQPQDQGNDPIMSIVRDATERKHLLTTSISKSSVVPSSDQDHPVSIHSAKDPKTATKHERLIGRSSKNQVYRLLDKRGGGSSSGGGGRGGGSSSGSGKGGSTSGSSGKGGSSGGTSGSGGKGGSSDSGGKGGSSSSGSGGGSRSGSGNGIGGSSSSGTGNTLVGSNTGGGIVASGSQTSNTTTGDGHEPKHHLTGKEQRNIAAGVVGAAVVAGVAGVIYVKRRLKRNVRIPQVSYPHHGGDSIELLTNQETDRQDNHDRPWSQSDDYDEDVRLPPPAYSPFSRV